jgi:hypothetical protein
MSSGTQVDVNWAGMDAGQGASAPATANGANGLPAAAATQLTDEEILGIDSPSPNGGYGEQDRLEISRAGRGGANNYGVGANRPEDAAAELNGQAEAAAGKTTQANGSAELTTRASATGTMPAWMQSLAADPKHGAEAQQLWREHQEFCTAFSSPEEARAIKELLPGGVKDVLTLREATQSVDRIDAAIFSGDARAQSEVVAELARANPAAFRSLFAEAAKVLAGMGQTVANESAGANIHPDGPTLRKTGEGWGTQNQSGDLRPGERPVTNHRSQELRASQSPATNNESQITNHESRNFDPAAYAAFERGTNETVARDVRSAIRDTLARVMPDGVAEGAARRIGEDIFNEIHRALAADRTLSEQVGALLRDPDRPAGGPRFGSAEQQRIASLLAGRARQLVPSVARRVIGEWTSTVLNTARTKAARQAAAASRVDIATPGGSLDSMPLGPMSARQVNYASMSDEDILGM